MDKASQSKRDRKPRGEEAPLFNWPFGKINLWIFLASLAVMVVGYILLNQGPADSVASRTLAPILLVVGYLILAPIALLIRSKK